MAALRTAKGESMNQAYQTLVFSHWLGLRRANRR
jgi:hypothetical protein